MAFSGAQHGWGDSMGGQFSSQFDHAASVLPLEDLADLHEASGASVHSRASGGPMNQREFVPSSHAPGRDDPMESLNQPENPESFNKILRQIRGEVNSRLVLCGPLTVMRRSPSGSTTSRG